MCKALELRMLELHCGDNDNGPVMRYLSRYLVFPCLCVFSQSRSYKVTDNGRANGDRRFLPPITEI